MPDFLMRYATCKSYFTKTHTSNSSEILGLSSESTLVDWVYLIYGRKRAES